MRIPKIIHQTWKEKDVPKYFNGFVNSWKKNHPEWQYILWTDKMNLEFIRKNYPNYLFQYYSYKFNIQRVDAVRYLILYKMGGVFVDLDFECFHNLQSLLNNVDCLFGKEPREQCLLHNKKFIISNAFMASIPKAGFMKILCDELIKPLPKYNKKHYVLETTGPFFLTRLYEAYGAKFPNIKILEAEKLYPLSQSEIEVYLLNKKRDVETQTKLQKAFALHYYWGSWWKKCELDYSLYLK